MKSFTQRLTIPEKGNPYYNTKKSGGYSQAITGSPTCDGLDVLANCSGYAHGRFHEIAQDKTMSMLCPVNAERFIDYMSSKLKTGTAPKLGACAVWQKGPTKNGSDGAGHVAIVEQINSDGSIITSESGYGNTVPFSVKTRKNDGNWGQPSTYKFLGFIYQPEEYGIPAPAPKLPEITFPVQTVKQGCKGDYVKPVQIILRGLGHYYGNIDGDAGPQTHAAIITYQKIRKLYVDGEFGPVCWQSFLKGGN